MKNYVLALGALALLASCSSEPSDFRPDKKVSTDAVYAGGRPTGLYPSNDEPNASHHAAGHGDAHGQHAEGKGSAHGDGHTDGEIHHEDASEAAATGSENQKSAVAHPATESATPEEKGAADAADRK
ncbi:MAG: hypothetical protein H7330_06370 [Hymenobacteraceae bacterium]|nr:hypothetical protein [Hymenobacteraceae bacterium]